MGEKQCALEDMVDFSSVLKTYSGKKVFVSGHTGFKGSWLAAWLTKMGAIVKGYSLAPEYDNGLFSHLSEKNLIGSVIADIRDREKLTAEIASFQPDFIFHLAAQPLVRKSYSIPSETFDVNVTGTANILEALLKVKDKCTVIIVTTDKVYYNRETDALYKENDELGGYDPYSASKACAELVVNSFRNSFYNLSKFDKHYKAIASARAGNVIGGGDFSADRLIPDIIRSVQAGKAVPIRNPSSVRPWQHVLEPLGGYLTLGHLLAGNPEKFSGAYNFGPKPDDHLNVRQLADAVIKILGKGTWTDESGGIHPHEANLLKLDITKANKELNWTPKMNSAKAVEWTVEWYKQSTENRWSYTLEQIRKYSENEV